LRGKLRGSFLTTQNSQETSMASYKIALLDGDGKLLFDADLESGEECKP